MNNATSIASRSFSLLSGRCQLWPQPSQILRIALSPVRRTTGLSKLSPFSSRSLCTSQIATWKRPRPQQSTGQRPTRSAFSTSAVFRRLKPYDSENEPGLTLRKKDLDAVELSQIFLNLQIHNEDANRLLKVLQARRVDGTLDIPLDENLSALLDSFPQAEELALTWLRRRFPLNEDAAIEARFKREESPREQEHPSALFERGQRLGLVKPAEEVMEEEQEQPEYYGPQSGAYYAPLSEKKEDVFGRSELERIRAENEAKAEEEEREMQERIDKSMAEAEAKHTERSRALEKAPEQGLEVSEGREVRPPNAFEKWVMAAQDRAASKLTLESPEVKNMSNTRRLLPSLLFVLAACLGLYTFAQYWEPPRRSDRLWPNMSLSMATCTGILAVNVLVFLLFRFPPALRILNQYFIAVPAYPYSFSMLGNTVSHFQFSHIATNMISLFIFGPSLHEDIGRGNFLALYFAAGLLGSIASMSAFVLRGIMFTSTQGASGCVWGITVAYFWLHKDDKFSFIFIPEEYQEQLTARGWALLAGLVGLDLFAALSRGGRIDLVAHWVGMAVGLGYTSWWKAEHGEVQKREVKPSFVAEVVTGAREKLEGLNTQNQSADTSQVER